MRSWRPMLGPLFGVALLGRACWIDRGIGWLPLSVPSASLVAGPLDTSVVLPHSGRYELVHEFLIPPGDSANLPSDGAPFVEVDGTVAGRGWTTSEPGIVGSYGVSDGTQGYTVGRIDGMRGDTLRLTFRASPGFAALVTYSPKLEVRRPSADEAYLPFVRDLVGLAGLVVIALSAVAYWRADRRRRASTDPSDGH